MPPKTLLKYKQGANLETEFEFGKHVSRNTPDHIKLFLKNGQGRMTH